MVQQIDIAWLSGAGGTALLHCGNVHLVATLDGDQLRIGPADDRYVHHFLAWAADAEVLLPPIDLPSLHARLGVLHGADRALSSILRSLDRRLDPAGRAASTLLATRYLADPAVRELTRHYFLAVPPPPGLLETSGQSPELTAFVSDVASKDMIIRFVMAAWHEALTVVEEFGEWPTQVLSWAVRNGLLTAVIDGLYSGVVPSLDMARGAATRAPLEHNHRFETLLQAWYAAFTPASVPFVARWYTTHAAVLHTAPHAQARAALERLFRQLVERSDADGWAPLLRSQLDAGLHSATLPALQQVWHLRTVLPTAIITRALRNVWTIRANVLRHAHPRTAPWIVLSAEGFAGGSGAHAPQSGIAFENNRPCAIDSEDLFELASVLDAVADELFEIP